MIEGNKTACEVGEYNDKEMQLTCFNCESGYICNTTANEVHDECPIGYECNDPTDPNLCPAGTNATQLGQTTCPLCDPGYNCAEPTVPKLCKDKVGLQCGVLNSIPVWAEIYSGPEFRVGFFKNFFLAETILKPKTDIRDGQ